MVADTLVSKKVRLDDAEVALLPFKRLFGFSDSLVLTNITVTSDFYNGSLVTLNYGLIQDNKETDINLN